MNSIKQIVIILLGALVVTGVLYGYGQVRGVENGRSAEFERREDFEERGDFDENRPPRDEGDTGLLPFNMRGILGFGKTLVPMTFIVLAVALITKVSEGRQKANKRSSTT